MQQQSEVKTIEKESRQALKKCSHFILEKMKTPENLLSYLNEAQDWLLFYVKVQGNAGSMLVRFSQLIVEPWLAERHNERNVIEVIADGLSEIHGFGSCNMYLQGAQKVMKGFSMKLSSGCEGEEINDGFIFLGFLYQIGNLIWEYEVALNKENKAA